MTTTSERKDEAFVGFLTRLTEREDRAGLAALRRGLGKALGEAPAMFPYLVPWTTSVSLREEARYYLIASLFALHPENWGEDGGGDGRWERNLGASLRRLGDATESGGAEQRVVALLNARQEDVPEHLRRVVALLKAHKIPVDWVQLLRDLGRWERDDHEVQRRWAKAFWRPRVEDEETGSNEDTDGSE